MANQTLRWIFFIPISILIYVLSRICITSTLYFVNSKVMDSIISSSDFSGHYFLGALFSIIREGLTIGFSVYAGVHIAPKKKKFIFLLFIITWLVFLIYTSFTLGLIHHKIDWNGEIIFRMIIELFAQIVGFTVSGIYVWIEVNKQEYLEYIEYKNLNESNYE